MGQCVSACLPKPNIGAHITLNSSTKPEEYYDLFWQHAQSPTITAKGKSWDIGLPRSAFVNEEKTIIWQDTKSPKSLFVTCNNVDMPTMGKMMGSEVFVA